MADIFDFEEEQLSSELNERLNLSPPEEARNSSKSTLNEENAVVTDLQNDSDIQKFRKYRSNSVISVGSLGNRQGTSYEVTIDETYEDVNEVKEPLKTDTSRQRKKSIQEFEQLKVLGKGSYGKVILVRDRETGGGQIRLLAVHLIELAATRSEKFRDFLQGLLVKRQGTIKIFCETGFG